MNRLDDLKREKIKKCINRNNSIRKISRTLNIPLSTVHYNIRKISPNYRKLSKIFIRIPNMEALGEILGIFAGDGNCFLKTYNVRIFLSKHESGYATFIHSLFLNCFRKNFNVFKRKSVTIIQGRSKEICNFLLKYLSWSNPKVRSICLRHRIINRAFGVGFLRGNFDTDGNIDDWNGYKRLTFATNSKLLANDIKFYLKLLKISYYIRKYGDEIRIRVDKNNAVKFIDKVGVHNNRYRFLGE
jgi:hypothetical protein